MSTQSSPITILQSLVRNSSLSGHEGEMADAAERAMQSAGFDRTWRDAAGNLIGELHGSQPGGKLVFDAHMDVVPVGDPETWERNPFSGELSEGRVWGRGATDNKGSLAAMIAGLALLSRDAFKGSILVVGSVGEEIFEGLGLQQVVDAIRPHLVVIGEPTGCKLGFGQRGRARVTFRVPGRAAHSSADDQSGNAVYSIAQLAQTLSRHTFPSNASLGNGSHAPIELISSPYPSLSTVPVECRMTLDRRLMPGETPSSVLEDYRKAVAGIQGADVQLDRITYTSYTGVNFTRDDFHPAWDTGQDSDLVRRCQTALRTADIEAPLYAVPYCTNASYSAGELGIPAIVFGPGDIAQAHAVNEFIEATEVMKAASGYAALAKELAG